MAQLQWTRTYPDGQVAHVFSADQEHFNFVVHPSLQPTAGSLQPYEALSVEDAKTGADILAGHPQDEAAWSSNTGDQDLLVAREPERP